MKFDFKNADITKLDLRKINLHDMGLLRLMVAVFIGLVFVGDLVLFWSINKKIQGVREKADSNLSEIQFVNALISKKDGFVAIQPLPEDKIDDLVDRIYEIADQIKLQININNSVVNDSKITGAFYNRKIITIDASGSFKELGTFLTTLRNLKDVVLDIKSINIKAKSAPAVQARIALVLFTRK